jgi:hypothetical protein
MTVSALRWFKAALVLQALLIAYWLTILSVDLFPWNDVASGPASDDLRLTIAINTLPLLALMAIFALGIPVLGMVSAAGFTIYLAAQLWFWWKPYAWGANAEEQAAYAEGFSRTMKVLPAHGAHLAPDMQHIVLHVLILLALIATAIAASRMRHL